MRKKPTGESWITNAALVSQDAKRQVHLNKSIRIVDGKIAEISTKSPPRNHSSVLDFSGSFIFPGFIQAHTHLCQTLFRNMADDMELLDWLSKKIWLFEASHTADTLYTSSLWGAAEALRSGTTCLLDMGTVKNTNSIFEAVRDIGIRASVGKCLMDDRTSCPPYLVESTDSAISEALELYKNWNETAGGRIRVSLAPRFALSCTEGLLRRVGQISRNYGILIHTHASENLKEIALVRERSKLDNIDYLDRMGLLSERTVLAHCVWTTPKEMKKLAKTGTSVCHCPSSNLKLASGIAPVVKLREAKINVALGADGAPCNNNLNILQELRLAALLQKPVFGPTAMKAEEALELATINGAKALNWENQIGSIEVGKSADLVAINLQALNNHLGFSARKGPDLPQIASSLVYATEAENVQMTMVAGKVLYRNQKSPEWLSIDAPSLISKIPAAQKAIQKRAAQLQRKKINR